MSKIKRVEWPIYLPVIKPVWLLSIKIFKNFFNLFAIEAEAVLHITESNEIGCQFFKKSAVFVSFWQT